MGAYFLNRNHKFNHYFKISYEETYDLSELYHIKLIGTIIPKMDYLDVPYDTLTVEFNRPAIKGSIKSNEFTVELIRLKDRKKALQMIRKHYLAAVNPFIKETLQNKSEDIMLITLAQKQLPRLQKLACDSCKHKLQCQIAFEGCHYEREKKDKILDKGIKVDIRAFKGFQFNKSTIK